MFDVQSTNVFFQQNAKKKESTSEGEGLSFIMLTS